MLLLVYSLFISTYWLSPALFTLLETLLSKSQNHVEKDACHMSSHETMVVFAHDERLVRQLLPVVSFLYCSVDISLKTSDLVWLYLHSLADYS